MSTSSITEYVGAEFDESDWADSPTRELPKFRSGSVYWRGRRAAARRSNGSRRRRAGASRRRHER